MLDFIIHYSNCPLQSWRDVGTTNSISWLFWRSGTAYCRKYKELLKIRSQWGIKVFICVMDNAANIKSAINFTGWDHLNCIVRTNKPDSSCWSGSCSRPKESENNSRTFPQKPIFNWEALFDARANESRKKRIKLKNRCHYSWNSFLDMLERLLAVQELLKATLRMLSVFQKWLNCSKSANKAITRNLQKSKIYTTSVPKLCRFEGILQYFEKAEEKAML